MSTFDALAAAAAEGRGVAQRSVRGSASAGDGVCAWNVALDRVRVIDWSQLEPRISLRRIHKEVKR